MDWDDAARKYYARREAKADQTAVAYFKLVAIMLVVAGGYWLWSVLT